MRRGIQRSGVKGLDCSAGCGVFVGYGYGIGLFLKPQAAEALQQLMQKAQGIYWPHIDQIAEALLFVWACILQL